ncbi:MAG: PAS domain S-box protein [Proteobacteria bacterium]|nr:PAS domain S-box protein [Pseudomonadota bacterium]
MADKGLDPRTLLLAMDAGGTVAWEWDPATDRVNWTGDLENVLGFTPEGEPETLAGLEALGRLGDKKAARAILDRALSVLQEESREERLEYPIRNPETGEVRWVGVRGQLVRNAEGSPRVVGTAHDITAAMRAQEELAKSEDRFREFFGHLAIGAAICEPAGSGAFTIKDVSPRGALHLGLSRESARGRGLGEILPGPEAGVLSGLLSQATQGNLPSALALEVRPERGGAWWMEVFAFPLPSGEAALLFEDVTERRESRKNLAAGTRFLSALLETIPSPIFYKDRNGVYLGCNRAFEEFLGKTRDEIVGKDIHSLAPKKLADKYARLDASLLAAPGTQTYRGLVRSGDGTDREVIFSKASYTDAQGKVAGLVGVISDVTDLADAERALAENVEMFQALFEQAADMILLHDLHGRVVMVNQSACQALGYSRTELLGMTLSDLFPGREGPAPSSWKESLGAEPETFEARARKKGGKTLLLEVQESVLRIRGEDYRLAVARDITGRARADRALERSRQSLVNLVENTPDAILVLDRDMKIRFANSAARRLFSGTRTELEGTYFGFPVAPAEITSVDIVASGEGRRVAEMRTVGVNWAGKSALLVSLRDITELKEKESQLSESREKFKGIVENLGIGIQLLGPGHRILEMNRQMREWFPGVRVQDHPVCFHVLQNPPLEAPYPGCPVARTFEDGEVHQATTKIFLQGKERILRVVSSPVKDPSGKVSAVIEMMEDVTEKLLLEDQLRQSQKMEAIGQLAGGVAHDFNNMLQVILGHAEFGLAEADPGTEVAQDLHEISQAGRRAADLTRQLLAFGRRQVLKPVNLDLNEKIEDLLKMIRRLIGENIELTFEAGERLGPVLADPVQVDQVVMNLCINAADAMPGGGRLVLETSEADLDEDFQAVHMDASPGPHVLLTVTDTGPGIPREILEHVFEPFFTTKEAGKGTGLGLATVYGIVQQHKGVVYAESEVGRGTRFQVYLPVARDQETGTALAAEEHAAGGGETILVVEDDEMVQRMLRRMLESAGYRIISASDGLEALSILEEKAGEIDMALLDVVMPRLGGREVHDRIQKQWPRIKTAFSSGYTASAVHTGFILEAGLTLIQKPYRRNELLRLIRKVLDGRDI